MGYLELRAKRAETRGMYVAALQAEDPYATIDWDEFVYQPRAIAVAEGWGAIDPWMHHDRTPPTWGAIPPLPATLFGVLIRVAGDIHLALYIASIVSVLLIGAMVGWTLSQPPVGLSPPAALLGAAVFVKMPWLAVKAQQMYPPGKFITDTLGPFTLGRPLDALTTVEAGLFTYAFYVLFIVLFWRAVFRPGRAVFIASGASAGLLVYVYFYHYIFAFALIASWILLSAIRREWRAARLSAIALAAGLVCAVPHFVNMAIASSWFDLPGYIGRLGLEPGRFAFGNLTYFAALAIPLAVGWIHARRVAPSHERSTTLWLLGAMVLAYIGVLNLRLVLGFDVQSDHYWRQSLGLPATFWVIATCAVLLRGASRGPRLALTAVIAGGLVYSNVSWLIGRTHPEPPSAEQSRMADRMALVVKLAEPGDVALIPDVPAMYHATVNARVRPFVPFVHALTAQQEIIRRYFIGQCLTGADEFRLPVRTAVPTQDETAALRSEQKYLLGTDAPQPEGQFEATRMDVAAQCGAASLGPLPRLDVVVAPESRQEEARRRLAPLFEIVREGTGGGYWGARVRPRGAGTR